MGVVVSLNEEKSSRVGAFTTIITRSGILDDRRLLDCRIEEHSSNLYEKLPFRSTRTSCVSWENPLRRS